MELLYLVLLISLVIQAVFFILLNIPTPPGVKGPVIKFLSTNNKVQIFLFAHICFCLLAVLLFVDSSRILSKYQQQKTFLLHNPTPGTELRKSELSYKSLLVQRNKYIAFMTIFVSVALNGYILLMRYMYQKRDNFELRKNIHQARTSGGSSSGSPVSDKTEAKKDK